MRTWIASFVCLLLLGLGPPALAQGLLTGAVVKTEQVHAELLLHAPQGVQPGKPLWAGLQLEHAPGWHSYWKNAGDSGLPTELHWSLPAGVQAGDMAWPTPRKFPLGELANYGYEGTVLLPTPLTVGRDFQSDTLELGLHAQWLVCRVECLPQEGRFVLRIPAQGSQAVHGAAFEAAWAAAPRTMQAGQSRADAGTDRLEIRLSGLPRAWRQQPLEIFLEPPGLIAPGLAWKQAWNGEAWTASLPYSPFRTDAPTSLPVVVTLRDQAGTPGWRVELPVRGPWPATAAPAALPPALTQALEAKAPPAPQGPSALVGGLDTSPALWVALAGALVGGLILNLMPCVFPVLALKVLAFARHADDRRANRLSGLAYTAGVVLSFIALGGTLLALRMAGEQLGWGFQLQNPLVIAGLALLFTLIGLNLAGMFDVGQWAPGRLAALQLRHPVADAALTGVLAVAVASPCTAPFMGASLGLAVGLPMAQALAVFAAVGLGMALPYLLASWFPGLTRALPRPGAWMETLKQLLAFPMLATVVWLLWVLGQQSGVHAGSALLLWLLGVALLLWSLGRRGRGWSMWSGLVLVLLVWSAWQHGREALMPFPLPAASSDRGDVVADGRWHDWTPERAQGLQRAGTPLFVDYTAAWCVTCQYNKATTLADAELLSEMATKGVVLLRADWTRRDPAVTQALAALGRNGVPTYALYPPQGAPRLLSEMPSVAEVRSAVQAF